MKVSAVTRIVSGVACVLVSVASQKCIAEVGVSDKEIVIGSSGALSGSDERKKLMSVGMQARIARINKAGGVNGRTIKLLLKDDAYDPKRALDNTKELVEKDQVFAMIGGNGTASANAVLPYLTAHSVPNLFRYSGGETLYQPVNHWTFQTRINYHAEAKHLIDLAVKKLNLKKIAVVYQDDAMGISGRNGVAETLANYDLKILAQSNQKRNMEDIKAAVTLIQNSKPEAVYLQLITGPAEEFIKEANKQNFRPVFLVPSATNVEAMSLADISSDDIYASEVVGSPTDTSIPLVKQYQADMKSMGVSRFDHISLEGYLGASVFETALQKMGKDVSRERLVQTLEAMNKADIGGVEISFSKESHGGLSNGYINHIQKGKVTAVNF